MSPMYYVDVTLNVGDDVPTEVTVGDGEYGRVAIKVGRPTDDRRMTLFLSHKGACRLATTIRQALQAHEEARADDTVSLADITGLAPDGARIAN